MEDRDSEARLGSKLRAGLRCSNRLPDSLPNSDGFTDLHQVRVVSARQLNCRASQRNASMSVSVSLEL